MAEGKLGGMGRGLHKKSSREISSAFGTPKMTHFLELRTIRIGA